MTLGRSESPTSPWETNISESSANTAGDNASVVARHPYVAALQKVLDSGMSVFIIVIVDAPVYFVHRISFGSVERA